MAKINSSDHCFLTHTEDIFIWPLSRKLKSIELKFLELYNLVDNLLYKAPVFIQNKL